MIVSSALSLACAFLQVCPCSLQDWASYAPVDFSYAGYRYGETAPPEVDELGYRVFDVTDFGAVPDDGLTDRQAFIDACKAAIGEGRSENPDAKAIIYFPEGTYILHTEADDVDGCSRELSVPAGNILIKGAGRDRTTIVMASPNNPRNPDQMWTSPFMLVLGSRAPLRELAEVTGFSAKGCFSVTVSDTGKLNPGDRVCLRLTDNSPELIEKSFAPCVRESQMTDFVEQGVKIRDYHKIKSIEGNVVTFVEPLMYEVNPEYRWTIASHPHYESVGVEDIRFRGDAKDRFVHHGSWQDDGAYKIIAMSQVTDGWIRRCTFESVSEGAVFRRCANISAYDIEFCGKRGHSSIYTEESSRVFMGCTGDYTSGAAANDPDSYMDGAGQWHAVGVSKPDMGNVVWRNAWGYDACFQCHATQPRATLLDSNKGGWVQYRQGGAANLCPNHMEDLVIWNHESTTPFDGVWEWWTKDNVWQKFLPPVIVGFHGEACEFAPGQCLNLSYGKPVEPESLYEFQLRERLGSLPGWVIELKAKSERYKERL